MQITVTLTDAQVLALSYTHTDFDFYINSIVTGQIGIAENEIVDITVKYCLDNGVAVPATRAAIVQYAFDNDVVQTAAERSAAAASEADQEA